ncbi:MAG: hypothetical protein CMI32_08045 [Opitutales bacterium]|nr:hypothetical protein [Opitutales bacterium]
MKYITSRLFALTLMGAMLQTNALLGQGAPPDSIPTGVVPPPPSPAIAATDSTKSVSDPFAPAPVATPAASKSPTQSLDDGLLAHYPFNGDAKDTSGNNHHGTIQGAILAEDRFNQSNMAYFFDGKDDYIDFGNSSDFNALPLSVSVWFKSNGKTGKSGIVSKYRAAAWNGWQVMEHKGKIVPWYLRSYNNRIIGNYGESKAFETVIENTESWNHLVCVFDENAGNLYLNGTLMDTKEWTGSSGTPTSGHHLFVGKYSGAQDGFYYGNIDEIRIYGRALNTEEIVALRDLDENMVNLHAGLIAHYPYSGDAEDHSGNGNHGTVNGATLTEDRFGMTDSAYAFDGEDDHVFADVENWTGDYTLSLWAKADETAQQRFCSVINGYDKTPGSKNTCQIHTSGGLFPTYQFFSSNAESFATVRLEWQHLAITVNKHLIRFYENGRQVYVQELEGGDANQFSHLIMGRNRHGNRHFAGLIDDVYVYDRALNPAEIERLHDGGIEDSDGDGLTDDYEIGYGRYAAIKGDFDWAGANADAQQRGGHIATITSEAEWHAVKEVLGTIPHGYYLGGTDEKTEGVWEWITGEIWKFTKWAPGEPNNLPRSQYGDEDHAQTWTATSDGNRLWNDIYSKKNPWSKGYILEYGYYTDPTKADSDGDGADDGVEVAAGTDPNNPLSRPAPENDAPGSSPGEAPVVFQEKIDELENEVANLRDQVEQRDASIAALEKDLQASEANAEQLKVSLASSENRVAELEKALQEAQAQIVSLEEQLDDRDTHIAYLESEVVQRRYSQQQAQEEADELARLASVPFVNGWCYLPEQGWLWTDASVYPYVYRSETKSWCYYQQGTLPRLVFDDSSKQWETWDIEEEVEEVESSEELASK